MNAIEEIPTMLLHLAITVAAVYGSMVQRR